MRGTARSAAPAPGQRTVEGARDSTASAIPVHLLPSVRFPFSVTPAPPSRHSGESRNPAGASAVRAPRSPEAQQPICRQVRSASPSPPPSPPGRGGRRGGATADRGRSSVWRAPSPPPSPQGEGAGLGAQQPIEVAVRSASPLTPTLSPRERGPDRGRNSRSSRQPGRRAPLTRRGCGGLPPQGTGLPQGEGAGGVSCGGAWGAAVAAWRWGRCRAATRGRRPRRGGGRRRRRSSRRCPCRARAGG